MNKKQIKLFEETSSPSLEYAILQFINQPTITNPHNNLPTPFTITSILIHPPLATYHPLHELVLYKHTASVFFTLES